MLGLPKQIAGDQGRVGGVVGEHQDFRRPGEQVDAAASEELALGFGDELVAGAAQDVDRFHAVEAESHQGKRGHAAQDENAIGPGGVDGVDRRRKISALRHRRRARHHRFHPRNLRRDDAHLGRAEHGITSAGDVAAHAVHGNVLVAEDDAGADFRLQGQQRLALGLGEAPDIALAIMGVGDDLAARGGPWRPRSPWPSVRSSPASSGRIFRSGGERPRGRSSPSREASRKRRRPSPDRFRKGDGRRP